MTSMIQSEFERHQYSGELLPMIKNILIAGGNTGIGQATTRLLSSKGTQVICASRGHDQVSGLDGVTCIDFDANDEQAPVVEGIDQLDGFVYCPGTVNLKPFARFSEADILNDLQINVLGAVKLLQANLSLLKKSESASVVFFSTVAVQTGMPFHSSVAISKGAIEGLTRSLAVELAPKIRVNCIAPSLTETPLVEGLLNTPEKAEASANRHPLKRIGNPEEVAQLVDFLLSEQSGFITAQVIGVDGGLGSLKPL